MMTFDWQISCGKNSKPVNKGDVSKWIAICKSTYKDKRKVLKEDFCLIFFKLTLLLHFNIL